MRRMKESFCDYDVPVSHLRLIDMVKEGKIPQRNLTQTFGDEVDPDELKEILYRHTAPYQTQSLLNVENDGDLNNSLLRSRLENTSGSRNSKTKRDSNNIPLLPSHPLLRRVEYIPSNVAVSGLPPPNTETTNRTKRDPFPSNSTQPLSSSTTSTPNQTNMLPSLRSRLYNQSPRTTSPGSPFAHTASSISSTTSPSTTYRSRQRYSFDPHAVQTTYESTFLTEVAHRSQPGNSENTEEEGLVLSRATTPYKAEPASSTTPTPTFPSPAYGKTTTTTAIPTSPTPASPSFSSSSSSSAAVASTTIDGIPQATSHTRRPLDGFLTDVVPTSIVKKKRNFEEAANNSFGLFLQMGGLVLTSELPRTKLLQNRNAAGVATTGASTSGQGGISLPPSTLVIPPVEIAQECSKEEDRKQRKMKEIKELVGISSDEDRLLLEEFQVDDEATNDENKIGGDDGIGMAVASTIEGDESEGGVHVEVIPQRRVNAKYEGPSVIDYTSQRKGVIGSGSKWKKDDDGKGGGGGGDGKEGEEDDVMGDPHPHLKMSINGQTFKESPTVITQHLTELSEGMAMSLNKRAAKKSD